MSHVVWQTFTGMPVAHLPCKTLLIGIARLFTLQWVGHDPAAAAVAVRGLVLRVARHAAPCNDTAVRHGLPLATVPRLDGG